MLRDTEDCPLRTTRPNAAKLLDSWVDWLHHWLHHWMNEWLNDCMNESINYCWMEYIKLADRQKPEVSTWFQWQFSLSILQVLYLTNHWTDFHSVCRYLIREKVPFPGKVPFELACRAQNAGLKHHEFSPLQFFLEWLTGCSYVRSNAAGGVVVSCAFHVC